MLLAANGGPTETLALLPGSAAIGAGRAESCPRVDQRGVTRKDTCDVGAYEAVPEADATVLGLAASAGLVALRQARRSARAPRRTSLRSRSRGARYSGSVSPEPPKSFGKSLNFGSPSRIASTFSP